MALRTQARVPARRPNGKASRQGRQIASRLGRQIGVDVAALTVQAIAQ